MNFLSEIIARKATRVERAKSEIPLESMRVRALDVRHGRTAHTFRTVLEDGKGIKIIAEFKRRSPSKGVIRAGADPREIARSYITGGAAAISVLTEEDSFDGSLEDLRVVRATVDQPILRKDFLFDVYQLYEAAANGADAVLLIVAALEDDALRELRELAEGELGLDALIEVHTSNELRRAVDCGATLIGVNNRNLNTFEVSLDTSVMLAAEAPPDSLLVSESGLASAADLRRLHTVGYKAFLIGESLMRAADPATRLRSLLE